MTEHFLPAGTHTGRVHLRTPDLERALALYRDLLGFHLVARENGTAALSATGSWPHHFLLTEAPSARPKPQGTTGLYHIAICYPNRPALARAFWRLVSHAWPFQGFADHLVSEALYLADPDGNGLELYVDRPRGQWRRVNGQIEMATDPLDVEGLLAEADGDAAPWTGVAPRTHIGHLHLQVSDLARAEAFYTGVLGLEVTQRGYPGALFLSAGGYHHHLGLNTWAGLGAPPPPADSAGLISFAVRVPDEEAWEAVRQRARQADLEVEDKHDEQKADGQRARSFMVRDPDGIGVEVDLERVVP
jgi:catechol 2,3-dioxygenase